MTIENMESESPLLSKASAFLDQLKEDNERLLSLQKAGKDISIETPDENDPDEITLDLLVGIFEPKDLISTSNLEPNNLTKSSDLETLDSTQEETQIPNQSPHIIEIPSEE